MDRLFHGTSHRWLSQCVTEGIKPRALTEVDPLGDSHPGMIYLTTCHAPWWAWLRAHRDDVTRGAIIEVDATVLNPALFEFDEVVLEQVGRLGPRFDGIEGSVAERLRAYRESIDTGRLQNIPWSLSLDLMGSIAYRGTVPPDAILRYVLVDVDALAPDVIGVVDPTVDTLTHAIRKKPNTELTNQLLREVYDSESLPQQTTSNKPNRNGEGLLL